VQEPKELRGVKAGRAESLPAPRVEEVYASATFADAVEVGIEPPRHAVGSLRHAGFRGSVTGEDYATLITRPPGRYSLREVAR